MNKGYYAIIPADVRYDARLTPNAKLLYGEITALCNEKGFCWAMNEYFADLYSVSKVSVSKWVGSLRDCGYIECQMQYKEGTKQITARYIRLTTPIKENLGTLLKKSLIPSQRKVNDPIKEKFKDNNTSNNTINTTGDKSPELYKKFKIPTVEEVTDYCRERNNTLDAQNFIDFYSSKGWLVGKNKMKDWQACIRTWETNDKKRAKENANKQTASDKRSDYASNFYDYDKATDF
jgi:DNA-binding transcriptional ArsR family regulator